MTAEIKKIAVWAALALTVYVVGNCNGRAHVTQTQAVDSFRVSVRYSDSVENEWAGQVQQLKRKASADSASASAWRAEASRLARVAAGTRQTATTHTVPAPDSEPSTTVPVAAYDSLSFAYDLMVRVDSLNQIQLAQKDSIIAADSQLIAALQRVRAAGIRAVNALKPRRFACAAGPSATIGSNGRSALGLGVTCGLRIG